MNWMNKLIKSVFTKLLVVIVLTGFCINLLLLGFFFAFRKITMASYDQMIVQYVDYLIDDLGTPPSVERARRISRQSLLSIRYQSPELSWSTSDNPLPEDISNYRFWHESSNIRAGSYRGRHFIMVSRGDGKFTFELTRFVPHDKRITWLIAVLFALLALAFFIAHLMIRWILRPVKWLNEGVQQVSGGNLDHRIPEERRDEFRDLAAAFNTMTDRIRDMLHAKEQLLLDVSHELRTPITRMKVALEMITESRLKDNIAEDLAEMEDMVSEILDTARSSKTNHYMIWEPIDIGNLIQKFVSEYAQRPPGVKVIDIPETVELAGDPEKVKILLRNILDNAIKYSNNDSRPVSISVNHQTSHVVIKIEDKGIGIPREVLPYIFEPFYRVDKSRSRNTGGYGLGLSMCKTIMDAHNGKIQVDSTLNIGTTVSLLFPESQPIPPNDNTSDDLFS
ncbi:MAG: HAMP domain-containing histidine kinase [Deltaproteobacteria bacterium]|nr:MAG: HAMP domain-containing histidine kinase [Deltaproteobacteria bacterium]